MIAQISVSAVAVVVSYVIVLTFVALRARAAREFVEFSVAGRALPLAFIFGSVAATYVGPGFSMGFVGKGFVSGYLFLSLGLVYAVQNIVVGLFVAPRLRRLESCHTLGDVMGLKYNKTGHLITGLVSVGICTGHCAVMVKAGGVVLSDVLGLPQALSIIAIAFVTAAYTAFGGLRASVITDAFQFAMFAILLPLALLLIFALRADVIFPNFLKDATAATSNGFSSTSGVELLGLIVAFLLGETLLPTFANRAFASRTARVSRCGFILAGLFSIVWFTVMVTLGLTARNIIPTGTAEDQVLLTLVQNVMPAWGFALLLVSLVSVIMSTLDSNLNAAAVAFVEDVLRPVVNLSNKTSLRIGRWATVAITAVAAAGAIAVPSIIGGLLICYSIWAPAVLPALIAGLWVRQPRPIAAVLSMITGTTVALIVQFVFSLKPEIAILVAFAASVLAYLIGHIFGKPKLGE